MPCLLPLLAASVSLALAAPPSRSQAAAATPAPTYTLRSTLLRELHSTHDKAEWFTPLNTAVAGLSPEQAKWVPTNAAGKQDPDANHSVGMLAHHILYWNVRALARLKGEDPDKTVSKYGGNNNETFNEFDAATWMETVHDLDTVMKGIEDWVAHATDAQLAAQAVMLTNISTHNAYHTGQILYVRKLQGSFDSKNGVK